MSPEIQGLAKLATVTVSYHPDLVLLERQLHQLPLSAVKVVVDNASSASLLSALRVMVAAVPNAVLLENSSNLGLAAALDQGVWHILEYHSACEWLLLLDQDSEPEPGSLLRLVEEFASLLAKGVRPAAVGPQLRDVDSGLSHGFHQMTAWRWRRAYPPARSRGPVSVANLNGSGTLMPLKLYREIGGLDHELFIDHVDTEWSFRLLAQGYSLWGIPDAVFLHRMGERGLRFWLGRWRVWPQRSPLRHRYLFRNTLWLVRRGYVPLVWKVWAIPKLILTMLACIFVDGRRSMQLRAMWKGVREGFSAGRAKL